MVPDDIRCAANVCAKVALLGNMAADYLVLRDGRGLRIPTAPERESILADCLSSMDRLLFENEGFSGSRTFLKAVVIEAFNEKIRDFEEELLNRAGGVMQRQGFH